MRKFLFVIFLLIIPTIAFAQQTIDVDFIQNIRETLTNSAGKWSENIKKVAVRLFIVLAGISFVMKFIMEVMSKGEIDTRESISFIVKFTITTGFFYYLLDNGITLANSIVTSFTELGINITGQPPTFSNIINVGFRLWQSGDFGWTEVGLVIPFFILCVLSTIFLLMIVANLVIEELSAAIMIYVGFFVLALGGFDYTRESAINFFKAILGVSMKILTIILILGITITILAGLEKDLGINGKTISDGGVLIYKALITFMTVFFLALISMKLPDAVANLVSHAWGNMGGLTMLGAISTAMNIGQKISQGISSIKSGTANAVAGYKDYNKNKEITLRKKEAEARGEDTSLNPMFNKQKTGSGKSYYGGKAIAAGVDISKKLKGVFGNSKEQSDISSTNETNNSSTDSNGDIIHNNTNINNGINNNTTPIKNNNTEKAGTGNQETDIQKGDSTIENSKKSHLDKGGQNV